MRIIPIVVVALIGARLFAAEEIIRATQFDLADGRKLLSVRYSTSDVNGETTYTIITLDGERVTVKGDDLTGKRDLRLVAGAMTDKMREEKASAEPAAAEPSATNAYDAALQELADARASEKDANLKYKNAAAELARTDKALKDAQKALRDLPLQSVVESANYDAAKAELAGHSNPSYVSGNFSGKGMRTPPQLRAEMTRAALAKAQIEQKLKDTQAAAAQLEVRDQALTETAANAKNALANAKAAVQDALLRTYAADKERTTAKREGRTAQ